MSNRNVLSRQLREEGCIIVGAGLAAKIEELAKNNTKLAPAVEASAREVLALTDKLRNQPSKTGTMKEVDHGTDGTIAPFHNLLGEGAALYHHNYIGIIPLTPTQQSRANTFKAIKEELFPNGTFYLTLRHSEQWVHLDKLKTRLNTPENQDLLAKLGLSPEAEYVSQWLELYGVRLGITKVDPSLTDPNIVIVLDWHEAWADFEVDVRSAYKAKHDPEAAKLKELLLSGYERRAEEEREADRRPRATPPEPK